MSVPLAELPAAAVVAWVRLRDELRAIVRGDELVALWGHGSRAFPDPPLRLGDIDAWAVLERPVGAGTARRIRSAHHAIERELAVDLDVGYILARDAARRDVPRDLLRSDAHHATWALHRAHWLAGRHVLLHGKAPERIVRPPTWAELERALRSELEHLERHVAAGDDDPYEASYAILNGSRLLKSIASRDVAISKRAAGRWALEHVPDRWHGAIRAALRSYDGKAKATDAAALRATMAPFVAFVKERLKSSLE
ncbi:MAG TPA: aminoglycoside adenylyltransferase domain-containing protein [Candidatus Limnocylindrales bacterium]|nr:aminoglycoside adenylyltransferase domain-containing protein [Candidatus Limnocylindrales bacterium]